MFWNFLLGWKCKNNSLGYFIFSSNCNELPKVAQLTKNRPIWSPCRVACFHTFLDTIKCHTFNETRMFVFWKISWIPKCYWKEWRLVSLGIDNTSSIIANTIPVLSQYDHIIVLVVICWSGIVTVSILVIFRKPSMLSCEQVSWYMKWPIYLKIGIRTSHLF